MTTLLCLQVIYRKTFIFNSNGMGDRCAFDGNQTCTLKTVDGLK